MFKELFQKIISTQLIERNLLIEIRYLLQVLIIHFHTIFCAPALNNVWHYWFVKPIWCKQYVTEVVYYEEIESCLRKACHAGKTKITQTNFTCVIVFSVFTLFLAAAFMLNVNKALFMHACLQWVMYPKFILLKAK